MFAVFRLFARFVFVPRQAGSAAPSSSVALAGFVSVLVALFTSCLPTPSIAVDSRFNAPTSSRNTSAAFRRFAKPGVTSTASTPKAAALSAAPSTATATGAPYAKNLRIDPEMTKSACALTSPPSCDPQVARLQLELTPLRNAMPETTALKAKGVYVRRNKVVVAYTFK